MDIDNKYHISRNFAMELDGFDENLPVAIIHTSAAFGVSLELESFSINL